LWIRHFILAHMLYLFGFAAITLAWLLPGHYFPWRGFQQETLAAIAALLLAVAALRATRGQALALPSAAAFAFGLALVPLIQWSLGTFPYFADALLPALFLCAFGLTVVGGSASAEFLGPRYVSGLAAVMVTAAVISTGIGLAQWLQLGEISYVELFDGGRIYGNFTQPNHLASLLGLGLVGVWWGFETRRFGPVGAIMAMVFIGFGVVMTQSRTSWVLSVVLALWWLAMRRRLALRTPPRAVAAGLTLFALVSWAWEPLNRWMDQPTGLALAERAQAGTRPVHWATLWDAAWREPWFGHGWQQVGIAQQAATLDHPPAHEWITFSHNLVLDLMVWNGAIPGLLLSALMLFWAVRRLRRCHDVHSWALLAAGAVLVIHALVEFPLAYAYFLLPFGMMVGALDSFERGTHTRPRWRMPRWVFASGLAGMAAMLTWIWVEYLAVEEAARAMSFKEAGYVTSGPGPQVPDVTLLDNQREFVWFRMTPAQAGMSDETVARMKTLSQRFAPPAAMLRYALVTGLNGREAEAARNLRLICHMWPARNCEEGRVSWAKAQQQHPVLKSIAYPSAPTEPR
jgi:O-antigen ligase